MNYVWWLVYGIFFEKIGHLRWELEAGDSKRQNGGFLIEIGGGLIPELSMA